jgi:hypothetical protein
MATGGLLVLVGLLIIAFSQKIVFPGLERLVGIETIVGKDFTSQTGVIISLTLGQ